MSNGVGRRTLNEECRQGKGDPEVRRTRHEGSRCICKGILEEIARKALASGVVQAGIPEVKTAYLEAFVRRVEVLEAKVEKKHTYVMNTETFCIHKVQLCGENASRWGKQSVTGSSVPRGITSGSRQWQKVKTLVTSVGVGTRLK